MKGIPNSPGPSSSKPTPLSALFPWIYQFSMGFASCTRMTPSRLTISVCRDTGAWNEVLPPWLCQGPLLSLQPGDKWPLKILTFSVINSPLFEEPRQLPSCLLQLMVANVSVPQAPHGHSVLPWTEPLGPQESAYLSSELSHFQSLNEIFTWTCWVLKPSQRAGVLENPRVRAGA